MPIYFKLKIYTKDLYYRIVSSLRTGSFVGIPSLCFYHFCLIFYVYININKYSKIIRIFHHFGQNAISQLLFGKKSCSLR